MNEVFAGVDLGGTNIACAVAAGDGTILTEAKVPTLSHEGPQRVLDRIAGLVAELSRQAGQAPSAIGIGIPGLVDLEQGITRFLPNLPTQWRDIPVRGILEPITGCPVYILNDARTAALGELNYGHGRDCSSMVFFTLGTGVGGAVVIDRRLRLGPLGAAGEIGHQTVVADGLLCGCGNRGCLETLASGPALTAQGVRLLKSGLAPKLHELVRGDAGAVTPREMRLAAEAGELTVRDAIERAAEYLGIGASNLIAALHPELIVFGGGVSELGPMLINGIKETIRRRVRMFPPDDVRVERSLLGDRAGVMGGIALAVCRGQVGS
jgi:glucokinase